MAHQDFIIGILQDNGSIKTASGDILLTRVSRLSNQPAAEAPPAIDAGMQGEMVVAQGELSGQVLYLAEIRETLPKITGALIQSLIEKQLISFDDIQSTLNSWQSDEQEGTQLCALVIGHKKTSPGASNASSGITEFEFNDQLAQLIEDQVNGLRIQRVYRNTYKELPEDINRLNPDFVVSLHCNAFNGSASGSELLYYYKSTRGKQLAELLQNSLVAQLQLPDRGTRSRTVEDRGGYLLRYTRAPCVIAEPFFIDNDDDLARVQADPRGLAAAYARAIEAMAGVSG